jgi:hypothetical protein
MKWIEMEITQWWRNQVCQHKTGEGLLVEDAAIVTCSTVVSVAHGKRFSIKLK